MQDYYKILNIRPAANNMEIRRAYREMAKLFHPDVSTHPEAQKLFVLINEAYEILIDHRKRYAYDRQKVASSKMASAYREKYPGEPETAYDEWIERARNRARDHSRMPYSEFMKTRFYKTASFVSSIYFLCIFIGGILLICYPIFRWFAYEDKEALIGIIYLFPIGGGFIIGGLIGMRSG